jgi:PAS domain S-box-containing protein
MIARLLRDLPLNRKLTYLCVLASGVALLLACAVFLGHEQANFKNDTARALTTLARFIGNHTTSALAFADSTSAQRSLESLSTLPRVTRACLYNFKGEVVATYVREPANDYPWPRFGEVATPDATRHLGIFHAVENGGIYLEADREEISARQISHVGVAALVLIVSMTVAWLIARLLQRLVSRPIEDLASVVERIATAQDYHLRATRAGGDEIGRLVGGFNHMLDQIEAREARLEEARRELERRVEERTRSYEQAREEVALERARFKFIFDYLPVGVCLQTLHNNEKSFRLINQAHLDICGIEAEKAFADPGIFAGITHPEDRDRQEPLNQALERGEIKRYALEKRYLRADGAVVWVAFSTERTDHPDGRVEVLSAIVDITALKQAQLETARERARFKFIFDALPVGVSWRLINDRDLPLFNSAHDRITGVDTTRGGGTRDAFHNITHPDDLPRQQVLIRRLLDGEIDHYELEKRYLHPDGRVVWVVMMSLMSRDPETGERQSLTTLVDITERKLVQEERDRIQHQLIETSRQAGMAEVATGVLHNVGNVLNSVNVSATLIGDLFNRSKTANLTKLNELLQRHRDDLGRFLADDPKGRLVPDYIASLAESVAAERAAITAEIQALHQNINHIKDTVAMQQSYAKTSGVVETLSVPDLVEDALRMNAGSLARHEVEIVRDYADRPTITVEKNKVLQILVNCIRNAKYACDESGRADKRIFVRIATEPEGVAIAVGDNGVGIPAENLTRIFAHGFTTRKDGHGFGLHSGALSARELGGALTADSAGRGAGATFTLRLPLCPPAS